MNPEVSIIIVTWNQPSYTIPCVRSVLQQTGSFEVIIVDNGSKDDSIRKYRDNFGKNGKVKIIASNRNLGYAGGNNLGVKKSKGKYIVILNNDTTVEQNWLNELIKPLKEDEDVGAVNSHEIRNGKRISINYFKNFEVKMNVLQYGVKQKRKKQLKDLEIIDSGSIKGACFAYRRELIGIPFDKDYFIYGEDTKLGWIIKCKGYKIKTAIKSVFNHHHNVTRKENKTFNKHAAFLGERNMIMNLLTFYNLFNTLRIIPFLILRIFVINILQPRDIFMRIKAYLWLCLNLKLVFKKRKEISFLKINKDKELFKDLTWKFFSRTSEDYN